MYQNSDGEKIYKLHQIFDREKELDYFVLGLAKEMRSISVQSENRRIINIRGRI